MVPVAVACAWCRRVRTSSGAWVPAQMSGVDSKRLTHGICPECLQRETEDSVLVPSHAREDGELGRNRS